MLRLWLLAIVFTLSPAAFAQSRPYHFDHRTAENGLPQNAIRAIVQARDGYQWVTTFDGLARFDGLCFTVFDKSNTPAIANNRFTVLYEDRDGTLGAGTDQGKVVAYRIGTFTFYNPAVEPRGASLANFRRDFNDELMAVTARGAYSLRVGTARGPFDWATGDRLPAGGWAGDVFYGVGRIAASHGISPARQG